MKRIFTVILLIMSFASYGKINLELDSKLTRSFFKNYFSKTDKKEIFISDLDTIGVNEKIVFVGGVEVLVKLPFQVPLDNKGLRVYRLDKANNDVLVQLKKLFNGSSFFSKYRNYPVVYFRFRNLGNYIIEYIIPLGKDLELLDEGIKIKTNRRERNISDTVVEVK